MENNDKLMQSLLKSLEPLEKDAVKQVNTILDMIKVGLGLGSISTITIGIVTTDGYCISVSQGVKFSTMRIIQDILEQLENDPKLDTAKISEIATIARSMNKAVKETFKNNEMSKAMEEMKGQPLQ